ncbi:MAG: DNA polymerase III subunit alpha [Planctomycetaceae bacterium]|nr:DNA polymerase III subunit alpha [Planctomycetaceae bacterium]
MSERPFVHLHCHSHYSLLDGASSIDRLIKRAKSQGMNALALTDHGNLHGALEFYRKLKEADLNPIIGYEAYIAPGSRLRKADGSLREASYHLTLLAQNQTGFKNLVKLASIAYLEGFYFKPRIDKEVLAAHQEGIICLSGCVSSELSQSLLRGTGEERDWAESEKIAGWFQKTFGDRYFVEIMNNGLAIQSQQMEGAVQLAQRMGLPLVATSDCHYVDPEDSEAQDVMLCINTGKFRTDTSRMKMEGREFYLRSPEDMYAAFPQQAEAVRRSQEIADKVDIDLELGRRHFPKYQLPQERSVDEYLRHLCVQGLQERYAGNERKCADGELAPVVIDRLNRELAVISKLDFSNYFLICWDFVNHARDLDIPAMARGSGVGAIVCYALYLSHVCPIDYDLLFERFLDENRKEAPDIDIDFCKERRGEIIRYVKEKYGEKNVAQIGTFGTLAARAAIKDVGRTLGIPLARVTQITSFVPDELGISLAAALEKSGDLRDAYENDPEIRELLDLARKIEGLARNVGTHAAAVVIADQPLTECVPLGRVTGKTDIITQWSMNDVEAAGLLKMDMLGLRNLTILSKAVGLIEQMTGQKLDLQNIPLDDQETFALLCRGETKGIFQLESGGIRDLLQRMKPDQFHDIIATNALYRPGPLEGGMVDDYVAVKHQRKKAEYKHPILKEILEETNGVMVYQEQVMRILNRLGGIELGNAYTCIKAISKKKEEIINKNHEQFIQGAVDHGLTHKEAEEFWMMIIKFAGYGFNKSHSTAYALIAYQTAYLKAHYPVGFMAALLSGDIPGRNFKRKDSLVEHLEDCQRMGIEVIPPDVNSSHVDFAVANEKIYFGLSAIKSCGGSAAEVIQTCRERDGDFVDLFDFCERIEQQRCNRATIETLIKGGAMDSFGAHRSQLMAILDRALQSGASAAADRRSGQKNLFGGLEEEESGEPQQVALPEISEFEDREKLPLEKEVLGFYLSSHPLLEYQQTLSSYCSHTTSDISELREGAEVTLGGMLSAIKLIRTRKGDKYANFDLEDVKGTIRCIAWPRQFEEFGEMIQPDAILFVRGTIDRRGGEEANLIVEELIPLEQLASRYTQGIMVRVQENVHPAATLRSLHEVLRAYPGSVSLQLYLALEDGVGVVLESQKMRVDVTAELRDRVDQLLGPGNLKIITAAPRTSGNGNGHSGARSAGQRNAGQRGTVMAK